jgi:thiamine biosynthesis lipoprotein
MIHLSNGAVATSGSYEIFFDQERVFHHVIDPATGASPGQCASVSVVANSVMDADALATTVFVLETAKGLQLIDSLAGTECLVLDHEAAEFRSRGWNEMV